MIAFTYRALNADREMVKGEIPCPSRAEALKRLGAMGLLPLDVREKQARASWRDGLFRSRRVKPEEIMVACRELAVMLKAGLPILRALRILADANRGSNLGPVLDRVFESIKRGSGLTEALEAERDLFSAFLINMVRTGEKGGRLAEVLRDVSEDMEHSLNVQAEVRNALAYPVFLLSMSGLALLFMFFVILPKFAGILAKLDVEIPAYSRMVLAAGSFFQAHWPWIAAGLVLLAAAALRVRKLPAVAAFVQRGLFRLRPVRRLILEVELGRFAHALSTLLQSGVEIVTAVDLAVRSMRNAHLRRRLQGLGQSLRKGESLHEAVAKASVFPDMAVHMVAVGEETGSLAPLLDEVSAFYQKRFRDSMKRMIALLEPAVILAVGLVIGFIVISVVSAIMSMNEIRF